MVNNLIWVRKKWERLYRIMGWEGADTRTSSTFFKEVVQVIILFRSETWVMTPIIGLAFGGFHHSVARCLAGMKPHRHITGQWVYPPM